MANTLKLLVAVQYQFLRGGKALSGKVHTLTLLLQRVHPTPILDSHNVTHTVTQSNKDVIGNLRALMRGGLKKPDPSSPEAMNLRLRHVESTVQALFNTLRTLATAQNIHVPSDPLVASLGPNIVDPTLQWAARARAKVRRRGGNSSASASASGGGAGAGAGAAAGRKVASHTTPVRSPATAESTPADRGAGVATTSTTTTLAPSTTATATPTVTATASAPQLEIQPGSDRGGDSAGTPTRSPLPRHGSSRRHRRHRTRDRSRDRSRHRSHRSRRNLHNKGSDYDNDMFEI